MTHVSVEGGIQLIERLPTTVGAGQFNTDANGNYGGYSSPEMDQLINATEYGSSSAAFFAYAYPALRDADRSRSVHASLGASVAGAGGSAGSRWALDRARLAELLGCETLVEHTKDAAWPREPVDARAFYKRGFKQTETSHSRWHAGAGCCEVTS